MSANNDKLEEKLVKDIKKSLKGCVMKKMANEPQRKAKKIKDSHRSADSPPKRVETNEDPADDSPKKSPKRGKTTELEINPLVFDNCYQKPEHCWPKILSKTMMKLG